MITLLYGLPASGKSTFLRSSLDAFFQNRIFDPEIFKNRVILSPDDFRMGITGEEYSPRFEEMVWFAVKSAARAFLVGDYYSAIIIDSTSLTVNSRRQWINIAKEYNVPIQIITFQVSFEECCRRNKDRKRVVPQNVMKRMYESMEQPQYEEGFSAIIKVNTDTE